MVIGKIWHLYIIKDLDPIRIQAIYHALALSIAKTPHINIILLTTTNKTSICCGYHQNFYEEINIEYCKDNNIDLVRRIAGGGLVLLDENQVFFSVILNGMGFPASIKTLFKISLKGPNLFLRQNRLNSFINYNELIINKKKISGIGAASIENAGIVIGNILLDFNYEQFSRVLNVPNESFRLMVLERIKKSITSLKEEMGFKPSIDDVIEGLKKSFEEKIKTQMIEKKLENHEIKYIEEIEKEYKNPEWNFRKKNIKSNKRSYLKIKNGVFVYHSEQLKADFLVINGFIRKIHALSSEDPVNELLGVSIFRIKKKYPEFKKLQEKMVIYCERTIR